MKDHGVAGVTPQEWSMNRISGVGLPMPSTLVLALCSALVVLALPATSAADNPQYRVNSYLPTPHEGDTFGVLSTRAAVPWSWSAGAWLTVNDRPFELQTQQGAPLAAVVSRQVATDVYGGIGLLPWLSAGVVLPIYPSTSGEVLPDRYQLEQVGGAALGDPRLSAKAILVDSENDGFGLAIAEELSLPLATGGNFTGDESVVSFTSLAADYAWRGWRGSINVGYRMRETVQVAGRELGDDVTFGLAGIAPVKCGRIEVLGAATGRVAVSEAGRADRRVLDAMAGGRLRMGTWAVTLAGGTGLLSGIGSPAWRATLGIGWMPVSAGECIIDSDEDGVPDGDDRCPKVAGDLKGCPDGDGDGIADKDDECPKQAGLQAFGGCPDGDGDGIPDKVDKCPKVKGLAAHTGCPPPDGDGDGVLDKDDRCPKVKGLAAHAGCPPPDGDGDGVLDKDDKCPEAPGLVEFKGCPPPDVKAVVTKDKIVILDKVFFVLNKYKIEKRSYGLLDQVATLLRDNADVTLVRVEGHTDSQGDAAHNAMLSQKRAEAVKAYLVRKKVAAARLQAKGLGDSRPRADNETEQGRAQNRRVEFVIVERKQDAPAAP